MENPSRETDGQARNVVKGEVFKDQADALTTGYWSSERLEVAANT